ncbi:helix-turn-helix transcriptional regulator [Hahella sp. CR1]|uniref:AraC family transcriptional regulator n=1 Tax=Hahella sp. CR1 TaxID=2992807 RepID=UPI0024430E22|nr:helix-turn-helix transcriptional regulator [Hahella sp. CR1]MDG9671290.1 helix-turn-helix transcriptional regulator [Hahella sp. CR1]
MSPFPANAGSPVLPQDILVRRLRSEGMEEREGHSHEYGQLFCVLQGLTVADTDAGRWLMPSSRLGWIPPGVWHGAQYFGAIAGWSLYLHPDICAPLPDKPCVYEANALMTPIIARIAEWPGGEPLDAPRRRLLHVLLDEIQAARQPALHLPMPSDKRLLRLSHKLLGAPENNDSLLALASDIGMSERTLTRKFREETGLSLGQWRQLARLARALELLAQGVPVTQTALDLGYDSVSAFIALFRRYIGETPGRYLK